MDRPYQPSWLETTSTEQKEWSEKDLKKLKDLVLFGDIPPSDPHYWSLIGERIGHSGKECHNQWFKAFDSLSILFFFR